MAFSLKNRVRETFTTTGAGPFTLVGAFQDHQRFGAALSVGDVTLATIIHPLPPSPDTPEWETVVATYSALNTLTINRVLEGTNGASAVSFSAGIKDVFIDMPAKHPFNSGSWAAFKNLKIAAVTSPGANQIATITADEVTLEEATNFNTVKLTAVSQTANTTVSGAGGIDTGAVAASTWYAVWLAYNPKTDATTALLSLSATAPTLPTDFLFRARVGWVRVGADSTLMRTLQQGRRAQYVVSSGNTGGLPIIASGASGSPVASPDQTEWTAFAVANFVPTTATEIFGSLGQSTGTTANAMVAPNNAYGAIASPTSPPIIAYGTLTGAFAIPFSFVLESTNIYYAAANATAILSCNGWTDNI